MLTATNPLPRAPSEPVAKPSTHISSGRRCSYIAPVYLLAAVTVFVPRGNTIRARQLLTSSAISAWHAECLGGANLYTESFRGTPLVSPRDRIHESGSAAV